MKPLDKPGEECTQRNPRRRPALKDVVQAIMNVREQLLPHQLEETFHFEE